MTLPIQRVDRQIFLQKYSYRLNGLAADYFRTEALISELTLAETLGIVPNVVLSDVEDALQSCASKIALLIDLIDGNQEMVESMTKDVGFYDEQKMLLKQLSRDLYTLILAIPQMQKAVNNWQLQESLNNHGENVDVRIATIAATRLICEILSSHSVMIEGTSR